MATSKVKIYVRVLSKHIKAGCPKSSTDCPVALALLDAGFEDVSVGSRTVDMFGMTYKLCNPANVFTERFDAGESVRPFTAVLTR